MWIKTVTQKQNNVLIKKKNANNYIKIINDRKWFEHHEYKLI